MGLENCLCGGEDHDWLQEYWLLRTNDHTPIKIQRKLKFWRYETPTYAFYRRVGVNNAEKLKDDIIAC